MSLDKRLLSLERVAENSEMPIPAIILFQYDGAFTEAQQREAGGAVPQMSVKAPIDTRQLFLG